MKKSITQANTFKMLMVSLLLTFTISLSFAQTDRKVTLKKPTEKTETIKSCVLRKKADLSNQTKKAHPKKTIKNNKQRIGINDAFLVRYQSIKNI